MTTDTWQARFMRTLLQALAGVAAAVATIDWLSNWKGGAIVVALGVIAALIAAAVAALQFIAGIAATNPLTKALVSFAQVFGAGLATVAVTEWSDLALINAGQAILRFAIAGVLAAVVTYLQNRAELLPAQPKA